MMQQLRLVPDHVVPNKVVSLEQVSATFRKMSETVHEVVLEINSHKFLINIKTGLQKLERFEIIAVKGFVEIGMKIVRFLKRLVTSLYFEY
ncbi:MAG: hypothetical protein H6765_08500 [Candidatus Peribacteria bacterium]|nr:MAG: hypothetical protein H6765_08500 [Candidatus Peribacteria bacterium]